jgi:uncharacterized protein (TIGR03435 family)
MVLHSRGTGTYTKITTPSQAPVLDQTGLTGAFDYRQTVPDSDPEFDHNTSFLRFISELGLKLDKSRGPIEILVIDSAAKPVQ